MNLTTGLFLILNIFRAPSQDILDHKIWNDLLKKQVSETGVVNYQGFIKDSVLLNQYLKYLESNVPQKSWQADEVKAYWINAYNAYTIQLVTKHYPIKSIKEIGGRIPFVNSTWDIKFININGEKLDLNSIEHRFLLNKFNDPRIHMAVVCASRSCPILRNEAFVSSKLNFQLNDQSKKFLADDFRNKINPADAAISPLFKWYKGDFKIAGGVIGFINKYSKTKISKATKIQYLDYDWNLNNI